MRTLREKQILTRISMAVLLFILLAYVACRSYLQAFRG